MTIKQANINGGTAQYQCYSSVAGTETTFEFGRTAPIPYDSAPDPPGANRHGNSNINDGSVMVMQFSDSSWDTDGFGAFYCSGFTNELAMTKISTFFVRSDGKNKFVVYRQKAKVNKKWLYE